MQPCDALSSLAHPRALATAPLVLPPLRPSPPPYPSPLPPLTPHATDDADMGAERSTADYTAMDTSIAVPAATVLASLSPLVPVLPRRPHAAPSLCSSAGCTVLLK